MFRKLTETKSEYNSILSNLNGISLHFDHSDGDEVEKNHYSLLLFSERTMFFRKNLMISLSILLAAR